MIQGHILPQIHRQELSREHTLVSNVTSSKPEICPGNGQGLRNGSCPLDVFCSDLRASLEETTFHTGRDNV